MKLLLILLPLAIFANVEHHTCTKEQLNKALSVFAPYAHTIKFQEKYESAIRKYCSKGKRDFVVYGVEK